MRHHRLSLLPQARKMHFSFQFGALSNSGSARQSKHGISGETADAITFAVINVFAKLRAVE